MMVQGTEIKKCEEENWKFGESPRDDHDDHDHDDHDHDDDGMQLWRITWPRDSDGGSQEIKTESTKVWSKTVWKK